MLDPEAIQEIANTWEDDATHTGKVIRSLLADRVELQALVARQDRRIETGTELARMTDLSKRLDAILNRAIGIVREIPYGNPYRDQAMAIYRAWCHYVDGDDELPPVPADYELPRMRHE